MTIRVRRPTHKPVETNQIAALITQSILSPSDDDAPGAAHRQAAGNWITWSTGLAAPHAQVD